MKRPDEQYLQSLLEKHSLGINTPEERAVLEQWYGSIPEKGNPWQDAAEKAEVHENMRTAIMSAVMAEKKKVRPMYWGMAAAAVVMLITGGMLYLFLFRQPLSYAEITAPKGKEIMNVQLPDASVVWLEPGTKVRYSREFGNDDRNLELVDGKAYFDVQQESEHPFIITAPAGISVKVLGTEFTVKAYRETQDIVVQVKKGAVQVADSSQVLGVLKGGQQLHFNRQQRTFETAGSTMTEWRTGNISLDNAAFPEVARILQDRYNIPIHFTPEEMAPYRFNFRLSATASLTDALDILKAISGTDYTIEQNKVTIYGTKH